MTVAELIGHLAQLVAEGHGDLPVYAAGDDEGNSYQELWSEPELRRYDDEEYLEEYGWHEDIEETNVVVL